MLQQRYNDLSENYAVIDWDKNVISKIYNNYADAFDARTEMEKLHASDEEEDFGYYSIEEYRVK